MVDSGHTPGQISQHTFQIDYRSTDLLNGKSRFRIYEDLYEYPVNDQKLDEINTYLNNLNIFL